MTDDGAMFEYLAVDAAGRRQKGVIPGASDAAVFERLRRDGYSPIRIRPAKSAHREADAGSRATLSDRESAELLSSLAALLQAGLDIRSALSLIGERAGRSAAKAVCRELSASIAGGSPLELCFGRCLPKRQAFAASLIAAGEAGGDLAAGFRRASEVLTSRVKLRDQLASALSYPAFVLVSTIAALLVILLFVVPSLAPLTEAGGSSPPLTLRLMIALSYLLRDNALVIVLLLAVLAGLFAAGVRSGLVGRYLDRLLLDGPARRTAAAITFGGFALSLGSMLSAGAPMSDALRLAIRGVRSPLARSRLEPVSQSVRQGQPLSAALDTIRGFPITIVRMAAVGEASGAIGAMLARAGQIEEDAGIRRIEAAGRILGPALIVVLGAMIGLLMAGLLTGVSSLGQSALQ